MSTRQRTSHKASQQPSHFVTTTSSPSFLQLPLLVKQQQQQEKEIRKRTCRRHHHNSNCSLSMNTKMTQLLQCSLLLLTQFLIVIVQAGWIDTDTPLDKRTTISKIDGTVYQLVRDQSNMIGIRPFCVCICAINISMMESICPRHDTNRPSIHSLTFSFVFYRSCQMSSM